MLVSRFPSLLFDEHIPLDLNYRVHLLQMSFSLHNYRYQKYSPNSFVVGNRRRVYSSSSDEDSRAIVSISQVISKQKWSFDNLEDELQQLKKPQDTIVVDSSPSSYDDEG